MNKKITRPLYRILITLGIYIVIMAVCILTMVAIPTFEHEEFLSEKAEEAAADYAEFQDIELVDLHTFGCLLFDSAGNCISEKMPENPHREGSAFEAYGKQIKNQISDVLTGTPTESLVFSPHVDLFSLVVGAPVIKNGRITGALFIIRNLRDLFPTLIAFCIVFTVIFITAALVIWNVLSKRQKYIALERSYIANFTHDLKSPIASIRALSETLLDSIPEDHTREKGYCAFIISESNRLSHTVKDILELSRIQTNKDQAKKTYCRIQEFCEPVFDKYRALCYDMMIDFHVDDGFENLPEVFTSSASIPRIMDILLDNAIKFIGEEGAISVNASAFASRLLIAVSDNGPGIDSEALPHVFERFFMGDKSHNSNGSGLGLAIAHELITEMNEKIWVESTLGSGTTFYFTIHYR